jgi:hypothetical protein
VYLNPSLLFEELSERYTLIEKTETHSTAEYLRAPLLYTADDALLSGMVYVGLASDFPASVPSMQNCCLISVGNLPECYSHSTIPTITVGQDVPVARLYNHVQLIFDKYNRWSSELSRMVMNDVEVQSILNFCRPLFPGTFFLVLDENYHVLATTGDLDIVMDETGSTPTNVLTRFRKDPEYVKTRFRRGTFLYKGKYFDHGILLHHIFINDKLSGTFSLAEHGMPITDGTKTLFNHLADFLDHCYQQRAYTMQRAYVRPTSIFTRLLSGEMLSESLLTSALSSQGWSVHDNYVLCFLALEEADRRIGYSLTLCRKLESKFPSAFALELSGNIVVILNRTKNGEKEQKAKDSFAAFISDNMLSAGISLYFNDLMLLKNYYIQAKYAYALSTKTSGTALYYFRDMIIPYMVNSLSSELNPETLCPLSLLQLLNSDQTRGTEYIKTLNCYFHTGMNATRTAKELFINRSTLLERLTKIWRIIDVDPDDYDTRLYLMLCLKILKQ